jgi:hypothetical protein
MRLRTWILSLAVVCFTACLAAGAPIDGTWTAEMKVKGGKKTAGMERIVAVKFHLKSDGDKASGTVVSGARKRSVTAQIVDGKIEGNRFSFTTVQTTKKGEQRLVWQGTVDGDTLQGTRSRNGGKRGQSFTARRG